MANIGLVDEPYAYVPGLEELIEACDEHFINIKRDGEGWVVNGNVLNFCYAIGSTPAEAIAKFRIALNKKRRARNRRFSGSKQRLAHKLPHYRVIKS